MYWRGDVNTKIPITILQISAKQKKKLIILFYFPNWVLEFCNFLNLWVNNRTEILNLYKISYDNKNITIDRAEFFRLLGTISKGDVSTLSLPSRESWTF